MDEEPQGRGRVNDRTRDAERLASLIDGRLEEPARSELLAQLASSDDDLDVFADALAALGEAGVDTAAVVPATTELKPAPLRVQSAPRRTYRSVSPRRWGLIAAIAAGLLFAPLLLIQLRHPSHPSRGDSDTVSALVRTLPAGLPAGWDDHPWRATRGESAPLTDEARAVKLGARLTDLALAVHARDSSAARYAASVAALLDDMPAAAPIAGIYRDVAARAGAAPEQLWPGLDRGAAAVRRLPNAELIELGSWLEGARVAAAHQDNAFFHSRITRDVMGRARRSASLPAEAHADVEEVARQISSGLPQWRLLGERLTKLLGMLGS